jgi:colanic acid biosynthesis glycosyl transferase WcaI
VTGTTRGAGPGRELRNGVEIVRVPSTAFARTHMSLRAVNYLSYVLLALVRGLVARRPDVVLAQTDPPVVGLAGLAVARRFRAPLVVVVQDLIPLAALRAPIDLYLRGADRVVAVGETMARRLEERGAERVTVIPNWVDTQAIRPVQQQRDGFVVMHSGNIGYAQDLDTLVAAAAEVPDVEIVIAGTGARRGELERLASGLSNVTFKPYVPEEQLSESLSSASLHFVGLSPGLSGYAVPSRLYGVLAAGRPVLVAADEDSEPAKLVREARCGIVVPSGSPRDVAAAIRSARDGEHDLEAMGARGRTWVVEHADRAAAIERYRELLASLLS